MYLGRKGDHKHKFDYFEHTDRRPSNLEDDFVDLHIKKRDATK